MYDQIFLFSSRRRHTRSKRDWSSDVCSSDLRETLDNEKQVQIVNAVYRIRTIKDEKSSDGKVVTIVYAEAAFYDLSFSTEKEARSEERRVGKERRSRGTTGQ